VPHRDRPRQPTTSEKMFLTPEQVADLANEIAPEYRALIFTAAYTGLRWGELTGLAVRHVDLLHRKITVTRQLVDTRGRVAFAEPKTRPAVALSRSPRSSSRS